MNLRTITLAIIGSLAILKKHTELFSFMENLKQIRKDANRRVDLEAQADLKGGFNAFIAGYDALDHAPKLLDKLYKSYHLDDELQGYPSLEERKKYAKTARKSSIN